MDTAELGKTAIVGSTDDAASVESMDATISAKSIDDASSVGSIDDASSVIVESTEPEVIGDAAVLVGPTDDAVVESTELSSNRRCCLLSGINKCSRST